MGLPDILNKALDYHSEKRSVRTLVIGTVTSVDNERTCTVEINEGVELFDVRLSASIDANLNRWVSIPKVGSKVVIGILENVKHEAIILSINEVEKFRVIIGNATLQVRADKIKIAAGGENLKVELNAIVDEIMKIIVVYGRGPNLVALTQIKTNINKILE